MQRSPELEAIVRRLAAAAEAEDLEKYRALFSDSPDVRYIGTDAHEWYRGPDEVFGIARVHLAEVGIERLRLLRVEAFENGDTGWGAIEQEWRLASGETVTFRTTAVFQLESAVWKIAQLHFSIPVPNREVLGVELTRTLDDLLESLNTESDAVALEDMIARTTTIVFTDVVGSTSISESMGDGAWSGLISSHLELLQEIVAEHGGTTVKTLGDGAMFTFPTATSALIATSSIQEAVSSSDSNPQLQIRIGVHTGDVVKDHGDYIGLTVNKAARVAAAAGGGEILVSGSTAGMVNTSEFEFGDPRTIRLKGLDGTHVVQRLHWAHHSRLSTDP